MIITVFPKDESCLPQDFETMKEAKTYADGLKRDWNVDSDIEVTEGNLI